MTAAGFVLALWWGPALISVGGVFDTVTDCAAVAEDFIDQLRLDIGDPERNPPVVWGCVPAGPASAALWAALEAE